LKAGGVKLGVNTFPKSRKVMKSFYTVLAATLMANFAQAKTYTLGSGKWTDAKVWNNGYPGTTIKTDDIVIITGQVTMNTRIVVEGNLTVNKGAFMLGMKDLVISKSGTFVNNGNTVMNRIVNEGTIDNNLLMEAMSDVDNKGLIENNNNLVAGGNFANFGGNAKGNPGGAYFVNNNVSTSPASKFGKDVKVFCGNQIQNSEQTVKTTSLFLSATFKGNKGVELSISNPEKLHISSYCIEKSTDGSNYTLLQTVSNETLKYTDTKTGDSLTYYRVKATGVNGQQITLPVATIKTPSSANGYSQAE
jgi:hypothetical protein